MSRPLTSLLSPRMLGLHLVAVLAVTSTVLLGVWQYGAWQSNRHDQADALAHAPAKPLASVMSADAPFPAAAVGQPVRLSGRWLPGDVLYVGGQRLRGRTGFWVVTPVAVCPSRAATRTTCRKAPAMLVVRGWTPDPAAAPPAPTGQVSMTGWLQPAEGSGTPDRRPHDNLLPQLRIADALQHVSQDLYGGYVIADQVTPPPSNRGGTLARVTPASLPRPDSFTSLRNLLYALEWWVFAGFAVFLWWRWCSDELADPEEDPQVHEPGPEGEPDHAPEDPMQPRPGVASKT